MVHHVHCIHAIRFGLPTRVTLVTGSDQALALPESRKARQCWHFASLCTSASGMMQDSPPWDKLETASCMPDHPRVTYARNLHGCVRALSP